LLQRESERLDEERLTTLELRIDADLACGRHTALVGELEARVSENPYRERLRASSCSRSIAPAARPRRCRVSGGSPPAGELGIEPSRALQELERSISRQDPNLEEVAADDVEARHTGV
jgi:DNA-binding SARP family transcriptional activator